MSDIDRVPLKSPVENPFNMPAVKHYVFNETGNIMMATTDSDSNQIRDEVREVFAEVSVFFAAMTRAISSTINPATITTTDTIGKPYNLYNYEALSRVIDGSGLFTQVTEQDVLHTSTSWGVDFSKELIESILGLATGAGELTFASAMVASMGKEGLRLSASTNKTNQTVGNIVFVCEYLMGMPLISAIVVYADMADHSDVLNAGPCFKVQDSTHELKMHKDTYMFVTPKFIHKYAGELDSVQQDAAYNDLITYLKHTITRSPAVTVVVDVTTPAVAVTNLSTKSVTYRLQGSYLGRTQGTLVFAGSSPAATITITKWGEDSIEFTVAGKITTATAIELRLTSNKTTADFTTQAIYTVT